MGEKVADSTAPTEIRISQPFSRRQMLIREIVRNRAFYAFAVPGFLLLVFFSYVPLYFLQVAFRNYRVTRALGAASWVGFKYFQQLFGSPQFWQAFRNTLIISSYKVLFGFPAPIILALLLNEIHKTGFKRTVQTLIYLPHFISWVVLGGIIFDLLSVEGGFLNVFLGYFGAEPRVFLAEKSLFRGILVISGIWKESGWGTIIYLATMANIDPQLYESATIDGANRFQKMRFIILPWIASVMVILLILRIGNMMTFGFQQVLVLYNERVYEVGDILRTYVYRTGILEGRYSYATAAGLFDAAVAMFLVFGADFLAKRMGQRGVI